MEIAKVTIENFRALKKVEFDVSGFGCVIGENNAGKSSLLVAIRKFLEGGKMLDSDYYDESSPVKIKCELKVKETDLSCLKDDEHRKRIQQILLNGNTLLLCHSFSKGESGKFSYAGKVPKEEKWREQNIKNVTKGKKGNELIAALEENYPEVKEVVQEAGALTITKANDILSNYAQKLSGNELELTFDNDLPTGLNNSIKPLFPEVIHIEAVKDLGADMRTADRSAFGKLLGQLLEKIEPKIKHFSEALANFEKHLNVVEGADGNVMDDRLEEVKKFETVIRSHLQASFPDVTLQIRIPPPEIKTILQSARINVGERGVMDNIENMGDGLKRAVLFSIFRAYAELKQLSATGGNIGESAGNSNFIILFEEPELYLHPSAQKILFESLAQIAKTAQVVVTTHSPLLFSATKTKAFSKLKKISTNDNSKAYSKIYKIDLETPNIRDQFQLLCYENNNAAFFAEKVVLVEGSSDVAAFKHIASSLNKEWDFDSGKTQLIIVGGKSNFKRFKEFFKSFNISCSIIADLDILVSGFDKISSDIRQPLRDQHAQLMEHANAYAEENIIDNDKVRDVWRTHGERLIDACNRAIAGEGLTPEDLSSFQAAQDKLINNRARLNVLQEDNRVQTQKQQLLQGLRSYNIYVLNKGCLEDYYPSEIQGNNKHEKAENFIHWVNSKNKNDMLNLAGDILNSDGQRQNEFELVFKGVFM